MASGVDLFAPWYSTELTVDFAEANASRRIEAFIFDAISEQSQLLYYSPVSLLVAGSDLNF